MLLPAMEQSRRWVAGTKTCWCIYDCVSAAVLVLGWGTPARSSRAAVAAPKGQQHCSTFHESAHHPQCTHVATCNNSQLQYLRTICLHMHVRTASPPPPKRGPARQQLASSANTQHTQTHAITCLLSCFSDLPPCNRGRCSCLCCCLLTPVDQRLGGWQRRPRARPGLEAVPVRPVQAAVCGTRQPWHWGRAQGAKRACRCDQPRSCEWVG